LETFDKSYFKNFMVVLYYCRKSRACRT